MNRVFYDRLVDSLDREYYLIKMRDKILDKINIDFTNE